MVPGTYRSSHEPRFLRSLYPTLPTSALKSVTATSLLSLSLELERSTCAGGWLSEGGGVLLAETGPRRTTRSRKRDVLCTVQRRERLRYCTFVHEPAPRRLHPYSHLSEGGEGSPWGQRSEAEHAIKENSSERYFAGSR